MPGRKNPDLLDYAQPTGYQTSSTTSQSTGQVDLNINPPNSRHGLLVTAIVLGITTSGTTTITLMFDGVTVMTWTLGTNGITSPVQLLLAGDLFVTQPNQTCTLRIGSDASRTVTRAAMTVANIPMLT